MVRFETRSSASSPCAEAAGLAGWCETRNLAGPELAQDVAERAAEARPTGRRRGPAESLGFQLSSVTRAIDAFKRADRLPGLELADAGSEVGPLRAFKKGRRFAARTSERRSSRCRRSPRPLLGRRDERQGDQAQRAATLGISLRDLPHARPPARRSRCGRRLRCRSGLGHGVSTPPLSHRSQDQPGSAPPPSRGWSRPRGAASARWRARSPLCRGRAPKIDELAT